MDVVGATLHPYMRAYVIEFIYLYLPPSPVPVCDGKLEHLLGLCELPKFSQFVCNGRCQIGAWILIKFGQGFA